jgi:hypothetical protein
VTSHNEPTRSEHRQRVVRRPVFRCEVCGRQLRREAWCRHCMPAYLNPPVVLSGEVIA